MENCILKDFQTMNKEFGDMVEKKLRAKSTYNKYLTVYKHLESFVWEKKKRTDKAWRRGIIRTDPFSEYKLEMEETDRGYLTEEELQTVANTVFVDKQTNLVRDMFLFGCFTGLSYIDIKTSKSYDYYQWHTIIGYLLIESPLFCCWS